MKYILMFLISIFVASTGWAGCLGYDKSQCPTKNCPAGTFMGNDGTCYSCWTEEEVPVDCLGYEKVFQLCPNRFTTLDCSETSALTCHGLSVAEINRQKDWYPVASFFNPFLKFRQTVVKEDWVYVDSDHCKVIDYSNHTCGNSCVFH